MCSARTARMLLVIAALGAAACGSTPGMTPGELAACTESALDEGSIGGSATLISVVSMRLPDDAIAAAEAAGTVVTSRSLASLGPGRLEGVRSLAVPALEKVPVDVVGRSDRGMPEGLRRS